MSLPVVLLFALACSGGASDNAPQAATGAESAPVESAAVEAAPGAESGPEAAPVEFEEAAEPVCSTFSFDMRGMPHIGPREVDQGVIQARASGIVRSVQEAAGQPSVQTFSAGATPFTAVFFGGVPQCEHARAEVAPPIPEGVSGRQRFRYTRATECGPCSQLILEALAGEE